MKKKKNRDHTEAICGAPQLLHPRCRVLVAFPSILCHPAGCCSFNRFYPNIIFLMQAENESILKSPKPGQGAKSVWWWIFLMWDIYERTEPNWRLSCSYIVDAGFADSHPKPAISGQSTSVWRSPTGSPVSEPITIHGGSAAPA